MSELVTYSPPAVDIVSVEEVVGEVEVWGMPVEPLLVTFRRGGGHEEQTLALSTVDLAAVLEYSRGSDAVAKIIRRQESRFAPWIITPERIGSEGSVYAIPQTGGTEKQRTYVFGPGVDLICLMSRQPRALDLQCWMSERAYELRSYGAAFASPEHQEAAELALRQAQGADLSGVREITEALERLSAATASNIANGAQRQATTDRELERLKAQTTEQAERLASDRRRLEEVEKRLLDLAPKLGPGRALPAPEADGLRRGELVPEAMAHRAGWFSAASAGTKPHIKSVIVAALNEGWGEAPSLLRRRRYPFDDGGGPRWIEGWVFTAAGVQAFLTDIAPRFRGERWEVHPNNRARRHGCGRTCHVQRRA